MQDDKLSYDEVLGQFDVLVDSPLTDYGHAVHEELWYQPAANYINYVQHTTTSSAINSSLHFTRAHTQYTLYLAAVKRLIEV